jgi:predicted DNA-binding protein
MERTKKEPTKLVTVRLTFEELKRLDTLSGSRNRSAFIRNLIDAAWNEYQKLVLS